MKNEKKKPAQRGKPGAGAKAKRKPQAEVQVGGAGERIAKRLARAGVASRRDAEAMIAAGRVKVNGRQLASPAFNVRPSDRIEVDGEPIPTVERTRLFLFHKPAGVVTTSRDPEGRRTIFDILPPELPRLVTVGRLDINTEGLLLLTNDGGLARVLELPSTGWLRRYRVRVHGKPDPLKLAELEHGIAVAGVFYGAITATLDRQQGSNAWLSLALREGKNREVKNVLGALGLEVTRLIRVSYGPFQLGELAEGAVQEVRGRTLRDQLGARLVEEAGANFEAPIARPFTNKPVRAERKPAAKAPAREGEKDRKTPVLHRKAREERSEALRERLQTKPPERPGETKAPKRQTIERRSRASHVWMAPGARPTGKKKAQEGSAEGKAGAGISTRARKPEDRGRPGKRPGRK